MLVADLIWSAVAQSKHRLINWLATQERLLIEKSLLKLHIQVDDDKCSLCTNQVVESSQHLFMEYSWSKLIRDSLMHWVRVQIQPREMKSVLDTIKRKK